MTHSGHKGEETDLAGHALGLLQIESLHLQDRPVRCRFFSDAHFINKAAEI